MFREQRKEYKMEKEEWSNVDVANAGQEDQIEIEFEEPQEEEKPQIETQEEEKKEEVVEEKAPELEGIETKGAEKRIRQLIRQRKERDEHIQALIQKNEELSTNLRTKDKEVNTLGKSSLDASEKQLTDKIELARAVYTEAFEEGDKEKVLKAQEMLNDAQIDLKSVTAAKNNYQEIEDVPQQAQPQPQQQVRQQPANDPRAEDWASKNDWFGKDNVMTAAALANRCRIKRRRI
jgi:spore germination cell wall hydrolase CwlJ-like protein